MSGLDKPNHDDELYLARGDEVLASRPLMTGDVVKAVRIPGVEAAPEHAMIITHPCSMRSDGVTLIPALHLASVDECEPIAWASCPRDRMPLPGLGGAFRVVRFDALGMVPTADLHEAERVACLSVRGVNLLQQRLIWYLTRFETPTASLNQLFLPIFDEIDMQEEWVEAAVAAGTPADVAAQAFHDWIREDDGAGIRRQDRLRDPQARSTVRRALDAEVRSRYR